MSSQIGVEPGGSKETSWHQKPLGSVSDHSWWLTSCWFTIEMEEHVDLEQILCPGHLTVSHTCTERHPEEEQHKSSSYLILSKRGDVRGSYWSVVLVFSTLSVLTIPSEWSASCRWWCLAHTPCRAPTGLCLCSRCWRTGSCGTGFPDRLSEPVYWTGSGFTKDKIQQGH